MGQDLEASYQYDLKIEGADEATLKEVAKALNDQRLMFYIKQDPDDPAVFSNQYSDYGFEHMYDKNIEDELHKLAVQFPDLKFHFIAENLDDSGKGYELKFQGDMYQRADIIPSLSDFCVPVPYAERVYAKMAEMDRGNAANTMIQELTKNTDYDLLYAQKKALLNSLQTGAPVPKEAMEGLINFLDKIGDLGEVLGRFRYDDKNLEPPFPMQPEYQKREVTFEPEPEQKVYVLCEELEQGDAIRQFTMLAVSEDQEGLKKLLAAKAAQDAYGYVASNGIEDQSPTHFKTEYNDGFVEYYIVEEPVLSPEKLKDLLASPEYDTNFQYPEGFRQVIVEAIRQIAFEEGFDALVDVEKAADTIMADAMYQAELKDPACYWFSSQYLGDPTHASDHITSYIYDNLSLDKDYFITLGAMEKVVYPEDLKEILVDGIYNVCRIFHLPVNSAEEMAEDYMRTAAFRAQFKFLEGESKIGEDPDLQRSLVRNCYDFVSAQLAPGKGKMEALQDKIQDAKDRAGLKKVNPDVELLKGLNDLNRRANMKNNGFEK